MAQSFDLNKIKLTEYAAEVMVYFERHKLIEIMTRIISEIVLEKPEDVQRWIGENLIRISDEIYSYCKQLKDKGEGSPQVEIVKPPGGFLHRIILFGRRGSGRTTQAKALVKRFDLVLIDAEVIIYNCLQNHSDDLSKELQTAFRVDDIPRKSRALDKIMARRLVQMDALRQGWVMVNYPNDLRAFKKIIDGSKIPPNKVIYMKCSETMAKRRLLSQPDLERPQDLCEYIDNEMRFFREQEPELLEYLMGKYETAFVNASLCFEEVKKQIWGSLDSSLYLMGDRK